MDRETACLGLQCLSQVTQRSFIINGAVVEQCPCVVRCVCVGVCVSICAACWGELTALMSSVYLQLGLGTLCKGTST